MREQRGPNRFFRILDRWYCRFWQRLTSKVHVLPEGPLILVGNHRAGVDPLLIQAAVNRPLCFLMDREYYQAMWYARWLFDASGVIPVKPGGANRYALSNAIEAIRQGNALCLFPEGAANPDIPLERILPGAVILAIETGAPILPFRITGTWPFDHIHLWRSFLRRGRGSVRFGKPITLSEDIAGKDAVRRWTETMRQALLDIK
ncbi:MAG: lysophospholipid acyltransferase family protein [Mariprofundaceae bacterium]|nr:lysophospholipid acyltransferase family protein [Mariprofundaceae bacterium]